MADTESERDIERAVRDADRLWEIIEAGELLRLPFPYLADHHASWDETVYQFLVRDSVRNAAYEKVIAERVPGKVVVEIGPGSRLFLTRLCAAAGARKIYAIEANADAYARGRALLERLGLGDRIVLIHGLSADVELPEACDICVSEIIGSIGNAEGVTRFVHDAWRFLHEDGVMLPSACQTWVSPVERPAQLYPSAEIEQLSETFGTSMSDKFGHDFEFTRYKLHNFPRANLLAPPQVFEQLDFGRGDAPRTLERTLSFSATAARPFDGLLLWVRLEVGPGTIVDTFQKTSWAPVHVEMDRFDLRAGDRIEARCCARMSDTRWTPAYEFEVEIFRDGRKVYSAIDLPEIPAEAVAR